MHSQIKIETAANGFIAYPDFSHERGLAVHTQKSMFVFENFATLTEWLDKNLQKPGPADSDPKH